MRSASRRSFIRASFHRRKTRCLCAWAGTPAEVDKCVRQGIDEGSRRTFRITCKIIFGYHGPVTLSAKLASASTSSLNQHPLPGRVVVKLGTNVIMRRDGRVALGLLCGLVESVAALREQGIEVLLVSSGAIGLGMERLGLSERPREVAMIQACAATGQSRLMSLYGEAFETMGYRIAQVLLTEDDFRDPIRYENLRGTLRALLALGVIPIVNENDTVSTMELYPPAGPGQATAELPPEARLFGDNDKLSALLMKHIDADLLVLLSDVDGLYDRHPDDPEARIIPEVSEVTDAIRAFAYGGNGRGRGGMASKLEAARIVMEAGRKVVIANGRTPRLLEQICAGQPVGTLFLPRDMAETRTKGSPDE